MKLGELMTEERELVFRSLVLSGLHIVTPLSNLKGQFDFSDPGMAEKEVKELHFFKPMTIIQESAERIGFKLKGIVDGWYVFAPAKQVLHNPGFSGYFERKDIVQLNMSYQNSQAGTLGFVTSKDPGRIEVFTKAMDTLIFTDREAIDHLIYVSSNSSMVKFHNTETWPG